MKKQYVSPIAKKVIFNYERVVANSGCSSGIWKEADYIGCETMTPDTPLNARAMPCGVQKFQS